MLCLVGDVGGVVKPSISVASFLLRLGGEVAIVRLVCNNKIRAIG